MTALAIDLGDKRCGIALELEGVAIPKQIVLRVDIIKTIKSYLEKYKNINTIVVGLPYDLYGKDLKQLEKTKMFIRELEKKFKDLKIVGIDERFTSFEADNILNEMGETKKIGNKDDISAGLILESFLRNK